MNNLQINGHEFKYIQEDSTTVQYICIKCNADVDRFKSDNEVFLWCNEERSYIEGDLMSCDEYIIKKIIE